MNKERIYTIVAVSIILGIGIAGFPDYKPLPQLTSVVGAATLNLFGAETTAHRNYIVGFNQNSYALSPECSGIILLLAVIGTLQLVPLLSIRKKLISLMIIPLLLLGNMIRIVLGFGAETIFGVDGHIFFHDTASQLLIFFWAIGSYMIMLKIFKLFPEEKKQHLAHKD